MKHSIVYLLLSFFLFISCGENDPFVPENANEDKDGQENVDESSKAPAGLLFTEEDTEAKNQLEESGFIPINSTMTSSGLIVYGDSLPQLEKHICSNVWNSKKTDYNQTLLI